MNEDVELREGAMEELFQKAKEAQDLKTWHVQQAVKWAMEREKVRCYKVSDLPKPWTNDPYIRDYRFCNVSRQDDKETIILNDFYRKGIKEHGDQDLWFNTAVARWINWSPTVLAIGWTSLKDGYDADHMYKRMLNVDSGKFYTGAYMVRGCTSAKEVDGDEALYEKCKDKRYFLAHVVFKGISEIGPPLPNESLESYHTRLTKAKSNGLFMAGQQIADLKYYTMRGASDWKTWAPWGPGPARFLNRMHGRHLEKQIPKTQYYQELAEFDDLFYEELEAHDGVSSLKDMVARKLEDAHDRNSNLLCETDKYIRLQQGGQVRSRYEGKGSTTTKLF